MGKLVLAEPRNISDLNDCLFYHTMDLPGYGTVTGQWDLRGNEASYLGDVSFQGKRVLEIGTASGRLCFTMERLGAQVLAYDLSEEQTWDIVPFVEIDYAGHIALRKQQMREINNAYWLAHRVYHSHALVTYGTVYEIPDDIGTFDICTFGTVLLHLRDPFLALQRVFAHVQETAIITDLLPYIPENRRLAGKRLLEFLPNASTNSPLETWWSLPPELVAEFLRILGFAHTSIIFHRQLFQGNPLELYTVVGHRKGITAN